MIGYTMVGSNDLEKSTLFYDVLFALLGVNKLHGTDNFIAWGENQQNPMFCITKPFDGKEATVGNGTMIAIKANSQDEVCSVHKKALELGAHNEGEPGLRLGGYYCAYFRDLDGNKLNIYNFSSK